MYRLPLVDSRVHDERVAEEYQVLQEAHGLSLYRVLLSPREALVDIRLG